MAARPFRVLVVPLSFGGHLSAMSGLIRMLRVRGHEVVVLAGESAREAVDKVGARLLLPNAPERFGFALLGQRLNATPSATTRLVRRLSAGLSGNGAISRSAKFIEHRHVDLLFRREIGAMARATAEEIAHAATSEKADVVVADVVLFGAAYGAKVARRPYVSFAPDPSHALDARGHPYWLDPWPISQVPHRMLDSVVPLKRVRASLGLAPQHFTAELFASCVSDQLHLVTAPAEFLPRQAAPHHVCIGPPMSEPVAESDATRGLTRNTVLVTGTTTGMDLGAQVLRATVEAVAQTRLDVVVAAGPLNGWSPSVPSNVKIIDGFVSHDAMLPHVGAVVTHGGWGLVGRALRAGTPLVVTPALGPQFYVAERIEALSLGTRLMLDRITSRTLQRACEHVMTDADIRASGQAMKRRLAGLDAEALAVSEIEALVAG